MSEDLFPVAWGGHAEDALKRALPASSPLARYQDVAALRLDWATLPPELQLPPELSIQELNPLHVPMPLAFETAARFRACLDTALPKRNAAFYGEQGSTKSTLCEQVAGLLGVPYHYETLSSETDPEELLGSFELINGETRFKPSPITNCMRYGGVLELAEVNAPREGVMKRFFSVLDLKQQITLPTGEVIHMHPFFFCIATANIGAEFVGSRLMDPGLISRLHPWVEVPLPTGEFLKAIVEANLVGLDRAYLEAHYAQLEQLYWEVRDFVRKEQVLQSAISTRWFIEFCRDACLSHDPLRSAERLLGAAVGFDADLKRAMLDHAELVLG